MSMMKEPDKAARSSLKRVAKEFARAGAKARPLYHEIVFGLPSGDALTMPDYDLDAFMQSHSPDVPDFIEWHGPHSYKLKGQWADDDTNPPTLHPFEHELHWSGYFKGDAKGLDEFKTLADSLYSILAHLTDKVPGEGWWGILMLFHIVAAREPTPLVRVKKGVWGWDDQLDGDERPESPSGPQISLSDDPIFGSSGDHIVREYATNQPRSVSRQQWIAATDEAGRPQHPTVWSLRNNLFTVASAMIREILQPDSVFITGSDQTEGSVFRLMPLLAFSNRLGISWPRPLTTETVAEQTTQPEAYRPRWSDGERKLYVGPHLVKEFKQPAKNQELVLKAFEEEEWPPSIDDPLPTPKGQTVMAHQRLRDTVKALNSNHTTPNLIRFAMNGTGEGVTVTVP